MNSPVGRTPCPDKALNERAGSNEDRIVDLEVDRLPAEFAAQAGSVLCLVRLDSHCQPFKVREQVNTPADYVARLIRRFGFLTFPFFAFSLIPFFAFINGTKLARDSACPIVMVEILKFQEFTEADGPFSSINDLLRQPGHLKLSEEVVQAQFLLCKEDEWTTQRLYCNKQYREDEVESPLSHLSRGYRGNIDLPYRPGFHVTKPIIRRCLVAKTFDQRDQSLLHQIP